MLRRETFSVWPVVGAFAVVTVVAVIAATRPMCCGGGKRSRAQLAINGAADRRFPEWMLSHHDCPRFAGELLDEPVDPWNHPYRVICVAEPLHLVITSAGEDGQFGTADDLSAAVGAR
jgi:hypothetical protein